MIIDLSKISRGDGCTIEDYAFLFGLVATLRPYEIAEVGTNVGASSITMCEAFKAFDIDGCIHTCDVSKACADIAYTNILEAGFGDRVEIIHGDVTKLPKIQYDLGFIDGDHSYEGTKKDFDYLKDKCKYIIFHDVYSCEGKRKCFEELEGEKISFTNRPAGHLNEDGEMKRHTSYQGFGLWKR